MLRCRRIVKIFVCLGLSAVIAMPVSAAKSISNAQKEKEELENQLEDVQQQIGDLQTKSENTADYLKQLDQKTTQLSESLVKLDQQIEDKKIELEKNEKELEQAKADSQKQYDDMKKRIKFLYENGNTAYLEMILEAESFADMLNKADFVRKMSEYDRNMLTEYQNTQQTIADKQIKIKNEYNQIDALMKETEQQKEAVEALCEEKQKEYNNYQNQLKASKDLQKEVEDEINEQDEIIAQLEAEEARKRKAAQEAAARAALNKSSNNNTSSEQVPSSVSASGFTWPCPSSRKITSDYGYRLHPIAGINKMHNGIDISAPTGTVIVAAASGTVSAASYNSSMGNYVMINHGGSLFTVYMHCSALNVSAGQTVNAGQTIAYVGSTGNSTGPHLHFSVRNDGSYVNPWNYLN